MNIQDQLLQRVSNALGKDYTHKTLLRTVNDLLDHIDLLQEENGAMAEKHADKDIAIEQLVEQNKKFRKQIIELKRKTGFRVYEENLKMAQELAELKGVN